MRVLITSDIHFGVPGKLEHTLWASKVIREYAHKHDIGTILVLGDLFHDRNNLNIQVLTTAYDFFDETSRDYSQEWIAFPGNHDMFLKNSWKVNSVRPLNRLITIIEDIKAFSIDGRKFWVLPFVHYESAYMQVVRAIEAKASPEDILLTHIGVHGASLNECFLLKHWSLVNFSDTIFKRVYSGHFHCYQQVGEKTWYSGSPIPFRFDEGLVEHGFLEFDTTTCEHKFIKIFEAGKQLLPDLPPAPDFVTCIDTSINNIDFTNSNARICLSRDYTSNELSELRLMLTNKGALSVKWIKAKQQEDKELQTTTTSNMGDGAALFHKWIDHDKPEHIDLNTLQELNKQVVEEGMERLSNTEDHNGDSA
jgi:DNA repair exonuclease SbcCD nuclease subunit